MSLESRLLHALEPWRQAPAWKVAFSGGLDSTVLLHLLARLRQRQALPPISVIHVHHGLQAAADAWVEHCRAQCAVLNVPLLVRHVQVAAGASVERAAREARYAVFAELLGEGEVLLAAQHQDDQAETLLLRLLRGAGARGLAAMPASRPLAAGWLLRPLLGMSRAELERWARAQGLQWIEDPSNDDMTLARNFLRHEILPRLTQCWPAASAVLARDAEQMAEADGLLGELAALDLQAAAAHALPKWLELPSLRLAPLLALSEARQRNALREWLRPLTLPPEREHWAGWRDLRDAAVDAAPRWRLGGGELRRAGGRLWWLSGDWLQAPTETVVDWPEPLQPLALPGNGRVRLAGALPGGRLQIRYRQGGEVLDLAGRGHRDLKRLLQECALPAFVRGRLPLLYAGEALVAVANLPQLQVAGAAPLQLHWLPPTGGPGLS
ncbi:tRNA(Ile)-lysidine synthase [Geopseudomonas sagittaria]|uniref:tRNA(Ile)-lysidine synthase n=1 Tax=Geopseudomonas sagittaria TaxID=1135990 RepID=A0A1I5TXX8_9GAMM|nr:tRNA lysidine(34) synthetase TilS [Pseudomonas sagittaria]SFP87771.1 tRNA(Ile)-lysidine synthase [Pseudomonas sagittaria]